jgi:hypothetical protein
LRDRRSRRGGGGSSKATLISAMEETRRESPGTFDEAGYGRQKTPMEWAAMPRGVMR